MPSAMMLLEDVAPLIDVLIQLGKRIILDLLFPIEELQLYLPDELSAQVIDNLEQLSSVAEFIVVPSRFSEEGLLRNAVVSCPVKVAPLGVKSRTKGRATPGLISCVARSGRFATHKNLQIICDSMSLMAREFPSARLIILTPEPFELLGGSNVRTVVGLADPAMEELIATADISCLPSGIEAFGLSVLESMACGVPAVVANAGALPEIVTHGRNGLLVPVSPRQVNVEGRRSVLQQPSAEALSRAMADLLGDRQLRDALAECALADASNFTWDRFARAHLS
jgi:glycosyltransferase involved in cell wall biosynthesis